MIVMMGCGMVECVVCKLFLGSVIHLGLRKLLPSLKSKFRSLLAWKESFMGNYASE